MLKFLTLSHTKEILSGYLYAHMVKLQVDQGVIKGDTVPVLPQRPNGKRKLNTLGHTVYFDLGIAQAILFQPIQNIKTKKVS